jgi:hypothetical protein
MSDLIYTQTGFYTRFFAENKDGELAIEEMIRITGDTVVRNDHFKTVLQQLRRAGYKVTKSKKATKKEVNKMFDELEELGII